MRESSTALVMSAFIAAPMSLSFCRNSMNSPSSGIETKYSPCNSKPTKNIINGIILLPTHFLIVTAVLAIKCRMQVSVYLVKQTKTGLTHRIKMC